MDCKSPEWFDDTIVDSALRHASTSDAVRPGITDTAGHTTFSPSFVSPVGYGLALDGARIYALDLFTSQSDAE